MSNYILRNVPEATWSRFRERAAADGWPMRALLLQLMADYAAGRIRPTATPPPQQHRPDTE